MVKAKYLYDIFDIVEKDYVIKNAYCKEVTEIIDMPHEIISCYSKAGSIYQGRYIVTRKLLMKLTLSRKMIFRYFYGWILRL
jgi:hypothetical protein